MKLEDDIHMECIFGPVEDNIGYENLQTDLSFKLVSKRISVLQILNLLKEAQVLSIFNCMIC